MSRWYVGHAAGCPPEVEVLVLRDEPVVGAVEPAACLGEEDEAHPAAVRTLRTPTVAQNARARIGSTLGGWPSPTRVLTRPIQLSRAASQRFGFRAPWVRSECCSSSLASSSARTWSS